MNNAQMFLKELQEYHLRDYLPVPFPGDTNDWPSGYEDDTYSQAVEYIINYDVNIGYHSPTPGIGNYTVTDIEEICDSQYSERVVLDVSFEDGSRCPVVLVKKGIKYYLMPASTNDMLEIIGEVENTIEYLKDAAVDLSMIIFRENMAEVKAEIAVEIDRMVKEA